MNIASGFEIYKIIYHNDSYLLSLATKKQNLQISSE